jgi:hypothetical protein
LVPARGFPPLLPPHSFIDSGSLAFSPQPLFCTPCRMFPVSCPPTGWEKTALRRPADGRIGAMQDVCHPAIQEARHGPPRRARSRRRAIPLPSTHSCSLHAEPALRLHDAWGSESPVTTRFRPSTVWSDDHQGRSINPSRNRARRARGDWKMRRLLGGG